MIGNWRANEACRLELPDACVLWCRGPEVGTQLCHILVMATLGSALNNCSKAGVNEGFRAWRQFGLEWEPKFWTRLVAPLMNALPHPFKEDIPNMLEAFERLTHDFEGQRSRTIDDDMKIGVTLLGREDTRIVDHMTRNSVRITTWGQMREEILEITRGQAVHRRAAGAHAARGDEKGKGKDGQGKIKGDGKGRRKEKESTERRATAAGRRAAIAGSPTT